MKQSERIVSIAVLLAMLSGMGASAQQVNREEPGAGVDPRVSSGAIAPRLEGIGDQHLECSTDSELAQQFVDQGLSLIYAFNHAEAVRAFQEALRHDPNCAMAYWGWALCKGPNLNWVMPAEDVPEAWEAIQKAMALREGTSAKERAYIEALATRYSDDPNADRASLDTAWAKAAKAVHDAYPDDLHAATLHAAALMNLTPWGYWTKDGQPRAHTETVLELLESVIERDPTHTGALHYYIHATEEHHPEKAEYSADQLAKSAPNAGHLVHMPSHIFMRLGRYEDAYEANRLAVLADEGYITACRDQGIYPLSYYPHNIHFMCWAAQRKGKKAEAMEAGRTVGNKAREARLLGADFALHQAFLAMPIYTMVRFGEWDAILREPSAPKDAPYTRAIHHYARGMAHLFQGDSRKAKAELESLEAIRGQDGIEQEFVGFAGAAKLLELASLILRGELAAKGGDVDGALLHLERAARLEDSLMYNEPPDWQIPVRHNLGAVLLEAGRLADAEMVYWTDLRKNPDNGYALFGLIQALNAQGNDAMAAEMQAKLDRVWADADVSLTTSRF